MKHLIYSIILLLVTVTCTNDFEEINTNNNNPVAASEELLLPTVLLDLSNLTVNETHYFGEIIGQYSARYQFNDVDLYQWGADDRFWSPLYGILQDVKDIETIAITKENLNYEAIAKILKAYIFSIITDAYGDVPMSEANRADEGIFSPVYDSQEAIYDKLLSLLEEANNKIDLNTTVNGDRLFDGDMMRWKKFANSLRLRMLLRISGVRNVSTAMVEIVSNPSTYPVFESINDDAVYQYSGVFPDIPIVSEPGGGREFEYFLQIPTTHFINTLLQNNDPRLVLWVSPRDCDLADPGCIQDRTQGVVPGLLIGDIGDPSNYSRRAVEFFESATLIRGIFMTYSELNFILAEARENGIINMGSAQEYYNKGVMASFSHWGITMPGDFLTTTIPYTTQRLYEQKWLALYHTGVETWFDWKRTGKPDFIQAGPATVNGGKVPVRLMYPTLEQSLNATNYNAAVSLMGGDNINVSSWWW